MGNMVFPYLMSLGCVWQVIGRVCLLRFMVQAQFDNTVQYSREREHVFTVIVSYVCCALAILLACCVII